MTFVWPAALLLLLLLPLFAAWYLRLQQRRRQLAARYGTLGMVQMGGTSRRRTAPAWLAPAPAVRPLSGGPGRSAGGAGAAADGGQPAAARRVRSSWPLTFRAAWRPTTSSRRAWRPPRRRPAPLSTGSLRRCGSGSFPLATAALPCSRRPTSRRRSSPPSTGCAPSAARRWPTASSRRSTPSLSTKMTPASSVRRMGSQVSRVSCFTAT